MHGEMHQCGFLEVPLDYLSPAAGNGRVYYARLPALQNVTRKGTIFVDTGMCLTTH